MHQTSLNEQQIWNEAATMRIQRDRALKSFDNALARLRYLRADLADGTITLDRAVVLAAIDDALEDMLDS